MLDQNIATLFAALIGGLLTIAGGLAANYYLHSRSVQIEKEKELRKILEELYIILLDVSNSHNSIKYKLDKNFAFDQIANLGSSYNRLTALIYLYLPSLEGDLEEYRESHTNMITASLEYVDGELSEWEYTYKFNEGGAARRKFRKKISALVKQKGYSYK